ncbi:hypothetical protein HAX54_004388 [Datura stramonium]|uniref:Uncharacterized protein n=1 Tax=Datura stramonium TaxID=4076 RepID=A0ABS8T958_DATST|nr:hypothetical protein [Datura stramonium]
MEFPVEGFDRSMRKATREGRFAHGGSGRCDGERGEESWWRWRFGGVAPEMVGGFEKWREVRWLGRGFALVRLGGISGGCCVRWFTTVVAGGFGKREKKWWRRWKGEKRERAEAVFRWCATPVVVERGEEEEEEGERSMVVGWFCLVVVLTGKKNERGRWARRLFLGVAGETERRGRLGGGFLILEEGKMKIV